MKRIVLYGSVLTVIVLSLILGGNKTPEQPTVAGVAREQVTATITQKPETSVIPVQFSIPKINVSALVEHVGLAPDKRMDVPVDPLNVAWYKLGVQPGQIGNAVIAAHFDLPDGSPGVFYDIDKLEIGDEIVVSDEEGTQLTFRVIKKEIYTDKEFPLQTVFGPTNKRMLNLITCNGVFDTLSQNYSNRLVVFTELVEQ